MLIVVGIMLVQFVFSAAMSAENHMAPHQQALPDPAQCVVSKCRTSCEVSYVSSARRLGWQPRLGTRVRKSAVLAPVAAYSLDLTVSHPYLKRVLRVTSSYRRLACEALLWLASRQS